MFPLVVVIPVNAAGTGAVQNAERDGEVVLCYEPSLGVVQRKLVGDCGGEAVSSDRAEKIRELEAERRRKIVAAPQKPIIEGRELSGIGTGFFVSADGKLLTNNHVVDGCAAISIATPDGRKAQAQVIDTQLGDDLALLQVPFVSTKIATFLSPTDLVLDDPITVIGYPDQGLPPIKPLVTSGHLGPAGATTDGRSRFRIHADIRRGNSGGPVVDERALVIGVVYAKIDTVSVFRTTGQKIRFVGVVVDNKSVLDFLDRNAVSYRHASNGRKLDADDIVSVLRPMVARVGCWH